MLQGQGFVVEKTFANHPLTVIARGADPDRTARVTGFFSPREADPDSQLPYKRESALAKELIHIHVGFWPPRQPHACTAVVRDGDNPLPGLTHDCCQDLATMADQLDAGFIALVIAGQVPNTNNSIS